MTGQHVCTRWPQLVVSCNKPIRASEFRQAFYSRTKHAISESEDKISVICPNMTSVFFFFHFLWGFISMLICNGRRVLMCCRLGNGRGSKCC